MMNINKLIVSGIISVIAFVAVAPALAQGPHPPGAAIIPGEVIVRFQPHVSALGAEASLHAKGLQPLEMSAKGSMLRLQVLPGQEAETIAQLMARGDVEFASYNHRVQAVETPNDPAFSQQWALQKIEASAAWDIYSGGTNVIIAVIDSGADLNHPDLQANLVPGWDFVNNDSLPDDDHGHGSHVAGITAAVGNNGIGITGVNWRAKIMPLKMLDASGNGSTYDLAQAVYYAVDHDARVINMSLGAPGSAWPCDWPEVEAAFNYAVNHGVLLVVASGNDGQLGVNCPGAYEQAMAVGSTTATDTRSYFSNYGPRLDIVAPGSSIYSTFYSGSYTTMSGTSMATPHVAGLAALLWSFAPALNANEVRNFIQNSADDLGPAGWDQYFGYGRINAKKTLDAISLQTTPAKLTLLIDDQLNQVSGSIQISTSNPDLINWTTTISPTVPWLDVASPASGLVSSSSSPVGVTLQANRPEQGHYDTYTATVIITGTTPTGAVIGPRSTQVKLEYVPQLHRYWLPLITKN